MGLMSRSQRLYGVVGLGQFGQSVVRVLAEAGREVIAADLDMDRVDQMADLANHAFSLDATDEDAVRESALADADVVVLALGEESFEATVLAVTILREMEIPQLIVRTVSERRGDVLQKIGAHRIIYPERFTGEILGKQIMSPGLIDWFQLSSGRTISEIKPRPDHVGQTLAELDLRRKHGVLVIGAHRFPEGMPEGAEPLKVIEVPGPEFRIGETDTLVVVGTEDDIIDLADSSFRTGPPAPRPEEEKED